MTAIVGVLCKDGVVIGTDSSATLTHGARPTIEQPTEKLTIIKNQVIVASTGSEGLNQRFCALVEKLWSKDVSRLPALEIGKLLSNEFIKELSQTYMEPKVNRAWNAAQYGALVAFPSKNTFRLCEFPEVGFQPELLTERFWYCSKGSTQVITDSFLALMRKVFWEEGPPSIRDGIFAVTWTLKHAIDVNPGGVNEPIRIAVLACVEGKPIKASLLEKEELDENLQNIEAAKQHLREFPKKLQKEAADDLEIPEP